MPLLQISYTLESVGIGNTGSDMLDSLITTLIILLILSLITEKFTFLVRKYCMIPAFFGNKSLQWFQNIDKKSGELGTDKGTEKNVEREVMVLSFIIGTLVALALKANLFALVTAADPRKVLFWDNFDFQLNRSGWYLLKGLGVLCTGFFLSFGSKFFHDLVDTLLQVKNLKRKLNDGSDREFNDIKEVDEYILSQENSHIEDVLNKKLENNENILFYELDGDEVTVFVKDNSLNIPSEILYKYFGKVKKLKVTVKEMDDEIITLSQPLFPSYEIANKNPYKNFLKGTFGYPVKISGQIHPLMLTCYHVVWNNTQSWEMFDPGKDKTVVHPIKGEEVGEVVSAVRNRELDAAIIRPGNGVQLTRLIPEIGEVSYSRNPSNEDVDDGTVVSIYSDRTGEKHAGYIAGVRKSVNIRYPDGKKYKLNNLILIKTKGGKPFSKGGDSGALVVDELGYAVGMIVAGDEKKYSFAIPIDTVLTQLNLTII